MGEGLESVLYSCNSNMKEIRFKSIKALLHLRDDLPQYREKGASWTKEPGCGVLDRIRWGDYILFMFNIRGSLPILSSFCI